jgi:tRNA(Ile)-lysidine synthase
MCCVVCALAKISNYYIKYLSYENCILTSYMRLLCLCMLCLSFRKSSTFVSMRIIQRHSSPVPTSASATPIASELVTRVSSYLANECQVRSHDKIGVCVSGGVDSMALMHLLHAIKQRSMPDLDIRIIHFNHKKRIESEEELEFVRGVSEGYGLEFHTRISNFSMESNQSNFHQAARDWRRRECALLADSWRKASSSSSSHSEPSRVRIASAHHADDQVETFFLRVLRGTHLSRLRGVSNPCILHIIDVCTVY